MQQDALASASPGMREVGLAEYIAQYPDPATRPLIQLYDLQGEFIPEVKSKKETTPPKIKMTMVVDFSYCPADNEKKVAAHSFAYTHLAKWFKDNAKATGDRALVPYNIITPISFATRNIVEMVGPEHGPDATPTGGRPGGGGGGGRPGGGGVGGGGGRPGGGVGGGRPGGGGDGGGGRPGGGSGGGRPGGW